MPQLRVTLIDLEPGEAGTIDHTEELRTPVALQQAVRGQRQRVRNG